MCLAPRVITRLQVWHCKLLATGQEYAIKWIDKAHLKRHQKEQTALAEKNTLVRLGSGHPGIVRLHWTFQDEWSLCKSYQTRSPVTSAFDPLFSVRPSHVFRVVQSSSSTWRGMESCKLEYLRWARSPLSVSATTQLRLSTRWDICTLEG